MYPKILSLAIVIALTGITSVSMAQTHPRRAEVNHRLDRQDARIHHKVKDGDMSKAEAAKLHHEDHQVRQEERAMASEDGGHITKQEQKTLNQQENHISHQIKKN